jgi:hypothetical protein
MYQREKDTKLPPMAEGEIHQAPPCLKIKKNLKAVSDKHYLMFEFLRTTILVTSVLLSNNKY